MIAVRILSTSSFFVSFPWRNRQFLPSISPWEYPVNSQNPSLEKIIGQSFLSGSQTQNGMCSWPLLFSMATRISSVSPSSLEGWNCRAGDFISGSSGGNMTPQRSEMALATAADIFTVFNYHLCISKSCCWWGSTRRTVEGEEWWWCWFDCSFCSLASYVASSIARTAEWTQLTGMTRTHAGTQRATFKSKNHAKLNRDEQQRLIRIFDR